jgi:hypothetical protein
MAEDLRFDPGAGDDGRDAGGDGGSSGSGGADSWPKIERLLNSSSRDHFRLFVFVKEIDVEDKEEEEDCRISSAEDIAGERWWQ